MNDLYEQTPTGAFGASGDATDTIDVAHLFGSLKRSWRFMLGCGVSLLCAVMGLTLLSRMTFVSTGRLYLGEVQAEVAGDRRVDLTLSRESDVASEAEILRSRNFVRRAVLASGGNASLRRAGWDSPRYWRWRWTGRDRSQLKGVRDEVQIAAAALGAEVGEPQTYEIQFLSSSTYELRKDGETEGQGELGEPLQTDELSITLVKGPKRRPLQGTRYALVVSPVDEVVASARERLMVEVPTAVETGVEPMKVLQLSFEDPSPYYAASFLHELMEVYLKERQAWKTADAAAAETFVSEQLQGMRRSLDATQQRLAKYREENLQAVSENEASAIGSQLAHFREQEVATRLQLSSLLSLKHMLSEPGAPLEAYLMGETDDAVLREAAVSLNAARQQLTELSAKFKEAAPEVRHQQAVVDGHLKTIRGYVDTRVGRAREHLRELAQVIEEQEARLGAVPGVELGLAQAGRDSEVYKELYSYLLEQQQRTALIRASTSSKNRILDEPDVPRVEQEPKLVVRMASGFIGFLIGALFVLIRTLTSPALRSDSEVRALTRLPIFAMIPHKQRAGRARGVDRSLFDVPSGGLDTFAYAEAFRALRTNLYHVIERGRCATLLISSPEPEDGKTTVTLALASMLAADEKRVLVVDADLRKPSHHELFASADGSGLEKVLTGDRTLKDAVHRQEGSAGAFDSIGFGKGTRIELLTSEALRRFLDSAREDYDFVLLDCASYPLVSDALALSTLVDFVVSIVRLGKTSRTVTAEHMRGLGAVAHNQVLVINNSHSALAYGGSYPGVGPERSREVRPSKAPKPNSSNSEVSPRDLQ